MANPAEFSPETDAALDIGGPTDLLQVGFSFDRIYEWLAYDGVTCQDQPVDFTGFNIDAEVLDSAGVVLQAFAVTPSTGDATGKFALHLDPGDVTTTLRDNAVKWQFRTSVGGTINNNLIFANFTVT